MILIKEFWNHDSANDENSSGNKGYSNDNDTEDATPHFYANDSLCRELTPARTLTLQQSSARITHNTLTTTWCERTANIVHFDTSGGLFHWLTG